jgi:hypothetical protein
MQRRLGILLAFLCAGAFPGGGHAAAPRGPATQPTPSIAAATVAAAPAAEYRFDALRFDGRLSGPQSLVTFARRLGPRTPLHTLRVDFSARIFETVEAEALH